MLELHHTADRPGAPHLLLLHGLEGSRRSHYVGGLLAEAQSRGWNATLMVFRGCGAAPNSARRFYHSGETTDLELVFATLRARHSDRRWLLCGISLGGNVTLKWLGEQGERLTTVVAGAACISVPFDLAAGARAISRGAASLYDRTFLRSLRRKALDKLGRHPDLFQRERLLRARTVYEFDDAVTAPVHGFADAADYYTRASAIRWIDKVRVKTLLLSSYDDPFLPASVLDDVKSIASRNPALRVEFHAGGGHVGFVAGTPWRPFYYAEWRAVEFLASALSGSRRAISGG